MLNEMEADWSPEARLIENNFEWTLESYECDSLGNQLWVQRQIFTSMSITGTSMRTPTTVASAAPEDKPKSIVAVAMATSKWLDAPIMAEGAASS